MARDGRYFPLSVGLFFVIAGLAFLSVFVALYFTDLQFLYEGRVAEAVVIDRTPNDDVGSISYTFKDASEHRHNGTAAMKEYVFEKVVVGDHCLVSYLSNNPDVNRLKVGYDDSEQMQTSFSGALLAITAGSLVIYFSLLRIKRLKRLPSTGVEIIAKVALEYWEETPSESPATQYFALTYTYTVGETCYIYGFQLTEEDLVVWIEEDQLARGITVYYDPQEPGFHVAMLVPGQFDQGISSISKGYKLLKSSNPELSELMIR